MNEVGGSNTEEEKRGEMDKKDEEEEAEDEDSVEWELRNTDSVFSELSELSRDYVESVDRGASVRGKCKLIDFFFLANMILICLMKSSKSRVAREGRVNILWILNTQISQTYKPAMLLLLCNTK